MKPITPDEAVTLDARDGIWLSPINPERPRLALKYRREVDGGPWSVVAMLIHDPWGEVGAQMLKDIQWRKLASPGSLGERAYLWRTEPTTADLAGHGQPENLVRLEGFNPRPETPPAATEYGTRLLEVAERYRDAVRAGDRPLVALAAHYGVPKTTVGNWVRDARKAGYLPQTTRGRSTT